MPNTVGRHKVGYVTECENWVKVRKQQTLQRCNDVSLYQVSLQKVVKSLEKWSETQWDDVNLAIFNKAC